MGTYTTNYKLFMPSVGEQGWGELVNGNFSTIDSTMAGLNTRLTSVEAYGSRITAIENEVNGNLSCTSITTNSITVNGSKISIPTTLSYGNTITVTVNTSGGSASSQSGSGTFTFICSPFPLTGKIKASVGTSGNLYVVENNTLRNIALTTTATEYSVTKCTLAYIQCSGSGSSYWSSATCTIGIPVYS